MRIMGCDPGSSRIGLALLAGKVLEDYRTFEPEPSSLPAGSPQRLGKIYDAVCQYIVARVPKVMVVESIFVGPNLKSVITVGQARGVILLAADDFDIPVVEYTPGQIKKAVTGNFRAKKEECRAALEKKLGRKLPGIDDGIDAACAAFCFQLMPKDPI